MATERESELQLLRMERIKRFWKDAGVTGVVVRRDLIDTETDDDDWVNPFEGDDPPPAITIVEYREAHSKAEADALAAEYDPFE